MGNRSLANAVLVLLAAAALGFAVLLATAPTALPPEVLDAVAEIERSIETRTALLGLAGVVGLFAIWRTYFSGATDVRDAGVDRDRSESSAGGSVDVVGNRTTDRVDRAIESMERGRSVETESIVADLRASLRSVGTARGHPSERLDDVIRRGDWTDDRIAATFLGDESAGTLSLWHRLRMWLFPARTFERRLERTLDEMERFAADGGAAVVDAPANGTKDRTDAEDADADGKGDEGSELTYADEGAAESGAEGEHA